MKMITRAFLAAMLAIGGFGCGDDDGDDDTTTTDMFTPDTDMGPEVDMFTPDEDMGAEDDMFVPPAAVNVRIAHLVPDAPNVRLCIGPEGFRGPAPPVPSSDDLPTGVPFRAVGGYIQLPIEGVDTYEARVFDVDTIDTAGDCSLTDDPLLTINVDTSTLTADAYYTVAAIGFVAPADFDCPGPTPGTTQACGDSQAARLQVYDDSDIDGDNALIRVLHAIPDAPNVDICYDADGSEGTEEDPVEIFENVEFGAATDYNVQAAGLSAGSFRIFAHVAPGMDCPTALPGAELFELTIPTNAEIQAAFGSGGAGLPIVTDEYAVGSVHTIFAEGSASSAEPAEAMAIVPIIDLPAAP